MSREAREKTNSSLKIEPTYVRYQPDNAPASWVQGLRLSFRIHGFGPMNLREIIREAIMDWENSNASKGGSGNLLTASTTARFLGDRGVPESIAGSFKELWDFLQIDSNPLREITITSVSVTMAPNSEFRKSHCELPTTTHRWGKPLALLPCTDKGQCDYALTLSNTDETPLIEYLYGSKTGTWNCIPVGAFHIPGRNPQIPKLYSTKDVFTDVQLLIISSGAP